MDTADTESLDGTDTLEVTGNHETGLTDSFDVELDNFAFDVDNLITEPCPVVIDNADADYQDTIPALPRFR